MCRGPSTSTRRCRSSSSPSCSSTPKLQRSRDFCRRSSRLPTSLRFRALCATPLGCPTCTPDVSPPPSKRDDQCSRARAPTAPHNGFVPAIRLRARARSFARTRVRVADGFAIGNVAAFDMADPAAVVSPGGVGFDINCGVRLVRTNLREEDVAPVQEELRSACWVHIAVGA